MTEKELEREAKVHYLVISRSCADLYEELTRLFADRPDIKVIVDRRQGLGRMAEIPNVQKRKGRKGTGPISTGESRQR